MPISLWSPSKAFKAEPVMIGVPLGELVCETVEDIADSFINLF